MRSINNPSGDVAPLSSLLHSLEQWTDQVGGTPIVRLKLLDGSDSLTVHVKLEGHNPTGSVKARTAAGLLWSLAGAGLLKPQITVVESTSGNLGVALARACRQIGLGFHAIVDPNTTQGHIESIQNEGAHLEVVRDSDQGGHLLARRGRVMDLVNGRPDYVWSNQYDNPGNTFAHFVSTGQEIVEQMAPPPDIVFMPVSTGGTLSGVASRLKTQAPSVSVIGVDVLGSIAIEQDHTFEPRYLPGIGASRPSSFLVDGLMDDFVKVPTHEALALWVAALRDIGPILGPSAAATLAGCRRYLEAHNLGAWRALCLAPDGAQKYAIQEFGICDGVEARINSLATGVELQWTGRVDGAALGPECRPEGI